MCVCVYVCVYVCVCVWVCMCMCVCVLLLLLLLLLFAHSFSRPFFLLTKRTTRESRESTTVSTVILCPAFCTGGQLAVNKRDPICIRSGSAGKHWSEAGPNDSCTPACFRSRSVWPKPDTVRQNQIGSGLVLHSVIQAVRGRTQPSLKVGNW